MRLFVCVCEEPVSEGGAVGDAEGSGGDGCERGVEAICEHESLDRERVFLGIFVRHVEED